MQHFAIAAARRGAGVRGPLPYRHLRAERMLRVRPRRALVPLSFLASDPSFADPWWTPAPVEPAPPGGRAVAESPGGEAVTETTTRLTLLDGRVVEHVRREIVPASGRRRKEFLVRLPDGSVDAFGSIAHRLLPLYGVASLETDGPVVVTEGAKAADALHRHGLAAAGTLTGALGTPSAESLAVLAGREVVLWPDNDEVGVRHMQRVARRLAALEVAGLRVARWVGAPRKADAADVTDAATVTAILDAATRWDDRRPVGGRGTVSVDTGPVAIRLSLDRDLRPAWDER